MILCDSARPATPRRLLSEPLADVRRAAVSIAVVTGMIATYNVGGVVWDVLPRLTDVRLEVATGGSNPP